MRPLAVLFLVAFCCVWAVFFVCLYYEGRAHALPAPPERMRKLPCAKPLHDARVCSYVVYDSAWGQVQDVVLGEVVDDPIR